MTKSKQSQLNKIAQSIIDDDICPELAAGATQLVMGDGSPDAEIVFIGEAPGKSEDEQGKPFVGAAGKFLNEMLESIGLKRDDVYITNIVKYRPPGNRDPVPEEIAAFMPYLKQQLGVIKPKLIATLGRFSMNVFLPELKISQVHGEPKRIRIRSSTEHETRNTGNKTARVEGPQADALEGATEHRSEAYEEYAERDAQEATQQDTTKLDKVAGSASKQDKLVWVILPLFHPAAALYNGGMRQTLLDDFARIPKILELINNQQLRDKGDI